MESTKEHPEPPEAMCTCGHFFLLHRKREGQYECVVCQAEGNYCGQAIDSGARLVLLPIASLADMPPLE
ncbi:MAG: hypothetical protein ACM3NH_04995 [Candidatus Saccharibacteria bacterium]